MIELIKINKWFEESHILKNISLIFEKGKCNLIIGSSGSGKTVLIKTLVGLLKIDSGEIYFEDSLFTNMTRKEKQNIRKQMGMLFQGGALFDSLNILDNVMFPLNMFTNDSYREKTKRVEFCLERVGLDKINYSMPSELSGGMKKRVAIARAIAVSPKYLFCDEPNSGLDPKTAIKIDTLIKEITEEFNITTVVNSHDMNSVLEIGDKVTYIHEGSVWWEGTRKEVLNTDNEKLNSFVFASSMAQYIKNK